MRIVAAEGCVKRPARVDTPGHDRVEGETGADDVNVPTQEVDSGEREIARADHHRYQEIAQGRRNRWNQEEKHHHYAVDGEEFVVRIGLNQRTLRLDEMKTHQ